LLLINVLAISQQSNCSERLKQARELFESGQIEQIPSLLDSCIKVGFSKDEKIQAYRLLIQAYLFDSNIEMADSIMMKLLNQYPDYSIESTDPAEFIELFNTFKFVPLWAIGITIGSNISQAIVIENYSLANINNLNSKYSPEGIGFNAGVYGNKYLKNDLWISMALNYSEYKLENNEFMNNSSEQLVYKEKSQWLSLPITLNRSFFSKKIKPFIHLGAEFDFVTSVSSEIKRITQSKNSPPSIELTNMNINGFRNKFNMSALGGIGATYNCSFGVFQFLAGYRFTILPYVNGNERYSNQSMIYYYQHIDDNFKINNIYFSIGFAHLFYKIKKKY
jgi:hypothetical protein